MQVTEPRFSGEKKLLVKCGTSGPKWNTCAIDLIRLSETDTYILVAIKKSLILSISMSVAAGSCEG